MAGENTAEKNSSEIIRCKSISKKFRSKTVLEDISFVVNRGEFLSLLGPSGCGKTTILRMLIGIEKPTSGQIIEDGVDITNAAPKDRNIGIVFQNYSLFPNMDVYHNISYALQSRKLKKDEIDKKVRTIIETVGLEAPFVEQYFTNTPHVLGGTDLNRVEADSRFHHAAAQIHCHNPSVSVRLSAPLPESCPAASQPFHAFHPGYSGVRCAGAGASAPQFRAASSP